MTQSTYTRLHGTTVDKFKIGDNSQRITLTGTADSAGSFDLADRDNQNFVANTTIFFTAYIVGKGNHFAAFEVKGCYIHGTTTVAGYVVDTYVNSGDLAEPEFTFDALGNMTVSCPGAVNDVISWTAVIDIVSI